MIRYFHPGDEDQFLHPAPPIDEDAGFWVGVQKCAAVVALATSIALAGQSTVQATEVFNYSQDDPAGKMHGQPDEDFWKNPVPPIPASEYQNLPYRLVLSDVEEIPAGKLFGQPDEDFWINPVSPVAGTEYQRLPYGSLLDPEEIPAGSLVPTTIGTDEDFWQNPVAPVSGTEYQRLPYGALLDPEEIPAKTLHGQPDEDFWQNPIPPSLWPTFQQSFTNDDGFIAPSAPFPGDEDFWRYTLTQPSQWTALLFQSTGSIPPATIPHDEDYWQNPVAPVASYPVPLFFSHWMAWFDDVLVPPPTQLESEDNTWQPALVQPLQWNAPLFDVTDENIPPSSPGQQDEDFWRNPVPPVFGYPVPQVFADDTVIAQGGSSLVGDEDFWRYTLSQPLQWNALLFSSSGSVPPAAPFTPDEDYSLPSSFASGYDPGQQVVFFLDDGSSVTAFEPDEDYWFADIVQVQPVAFYPPPVQAFTYDDVRTQVPTTIHTDEDFWNNDVAPIPSTFGKLYLPDPDEIPALVGPSAANPIDEYWQNPVPPVPATNYVTLPYLPDPEEIPAGNLSAIVRDEDFWQNFVPPVVASNYQKLPYLPDGDDVPAGVLYNQPDEDFWINPVAPIPLTFGPLYLPDPEEIPAGNLHGPTVPIQDEDFWMNPVLPVAASLWQRLPYLPDADEIPAGDLFNLFTPDEDDTGTLHLLVSEPLQQILLFLDDGSTTLGFQPDEDFAINQIVVVPPIAYYPVPTQAFLDDNTIEQLPTTIDVDEVYWVNPVAPVPLTFGKLYLPDPEEIPAGDLVPPGSANPIDEYWQNPAAPVIGSNYVALPYLPDPEEIPVGHLFGLYDEDFWQNPTAPIPATEYQRLPYGALLDPEEIPAGFTFGQYDEDFWQNPVPASFPNNYLNLPYVPDPDEIPAGSLGYVQDEDFWQNPVPPANWNNIVLNPFPDDDLNVFGMEEEFWFNPVAPISFYAPPLVFIEQDDFLVIPLPEMDEDFWQNPVAPIPGYTPPLVFSDDEIWDAPQPIQDEDFWMNPVLPVPATNYVQLPYLPDPEEIPAGNLLGFIPLSIIGSGKIAQVGGTGQVTSIEGSRSNQRIMSLTIPVNTLFTLTWTLTDAQGNPINDAAVTANLYAARSPQNPELTPGTVVPPISNLNLAYVIGSAGQYSAAVPAAVNPPPDGPGYTLVIDATINGVQAYHAEEPAVIETSGSDLDLTTVDQVKAWAQIPATSTTTDAVLQSCITAFSYAFLGMTGQGDQNVDFQQSPFTAICTFNETYDGKGTSRLFLRNRPIRSVTSLIINNLPIAQSPSWPVNGWVVDGTGKSLSLRGGGPGWGSFNNYSAWQAGPYRAFGGGLKFWHGIQNVNVTYTAGYANTPQDIVECANKVVQVNYLRSLRPDELSRTMAGGGGSIRWAPWAIPPECQMVIDRYSRTL